MSLCRQQQRNKRTWRKFELPQTSRRQVHCSGGARHGHDSICGRRVCNCSCRRRRGRSRMRAGRRQRGRFRALSQRARLRVSPKARVRLRNRNRLQRSALRSFGLAVLRNPRVRKHLSQSQTVGGVLHQNLPHHTSDNSMSNKSQVRCWQRSTVPSGSGPWPHRRNTRGTRAQHARFSGTSPRSSWSVPRQPTG